MIINTTEMLVVSSISITTVCTCVKYGSTFIGTTKLQGVILHFVVSTLRAFFFNLVKTKLRLPNGSYTCLLTNAPSPTSSLCNTVLTTDRLDLSVEGNAFSLDLVTTRRSSKFLDG